MSKIKLALCFLTFLVLCTASTFASAQHGIKVSWIQSTGCSPNPCTIVKNTVYSAPTSAGPFVQIFTSTTPVTSYLDPLTSGNGGTQACYVVTAWTSSIESNQSSPPVCNTFPLQATSPSGVSATQQ